jgi:hypothetical protein
VDLTALSFVFVAHFIRVDLRGASLEAKTERSITWTDDSFGNGKRKAKRRILFKISVISVKIESGGLSSGCFRGVHDVSKVHNV